MHIAPRLQPALQLLLEAHDYAVDLGSGAWEFAVEIEPLREAGLTNSDIRWLLLKGCLAHALEVTEPGSERRAFQPQGGALTERSCFVLTPGGVAVARSATRGGILAGGEIAPLPAAGGGPFWDSQRRALWLGRCLVKQFKVPAPNQEIILAAFAEEDWPVRIDDPLPLRAAIDPKRRLHDTIKSLNRHQKAPLIHFQGDGSGKAVCWTPAAGARPGEAGRAAERA
jgi:hypothetical protein